MNLLAAALLTISGAMGASAQTSFDQYFAANKAHRVGEREAAFLKDCGLDRSSAVVIYGLSTENEGLKFHRTSGLLRGRDEAQSDFFGTAEVWKVNGEPRFVSAWMLVMDVGSESNEMFCLDETGRVTKQESLNGMYGQTDDGPNWIYTQRFAFDSAGEKRVIRSGYLHQDGLPAATPKLDSEDLKNSKRALDCNLANDVIAQLSQ